MLSRLGYLLLSSAKNIEISTIEYNNDMIGIKLKFLVAVRKRIESGGF